MWIETPDGRFINLNDYQEIRTAGPTILGVREWRVEPLFYAVSEEAAIAWVRQKLMPIEWRQFGIQCNVPQLPRG